MPDELTAPPSEYDSARLLEPWAWLTRAEVELLAVSLFGHLFVLRPGSDVCCVDVLTGTLVPVASCREELAAAVHDTAFQEEWLLASLGQAVAARGLVRPHHHCYAFVTPPSLGGRLDPDNVVPWELQAYHVGLSQLFRQIGQLPLGTHVVIKPQSND